MAEENFDAKNQALMNRWERKLERERARAAASERNFKKTFADMLKDPNNKKTIARQAKEVIEGGESNNPLFRQAVEGITVNDGEVITGLEPRPWDDDYDWEE